MARCEVAVRTNVAFHTRNRFVISDPRAPEQVVIEFEGREFVWHPNLEPGPEGQEWWPGVTVVVNDHDDYDEEAELMHRFLSALAFHLHLPAEVLMLGGSGASDPKAPPAPHWPRRGLADHLHRAPAAVEVVADDRLRLVLALYREGLNSESPFYRFLSLWNALDAVLDNDPARLSGFINAEARRLAGRYGYIAWPIDWARYLYDSNRNAIAHAVRQPGRPLLDPDDPSDRGRLYRDSHLLDDLVQVAVERRWPSAVRFVPPSE